MLSNFDIYWRINFRGNLLSKIKYGWWPENVLINTPDVVSSVLSVSLHRKWSLKVPQVLVIIIMWEHVF